MATVAVGPYWAAGFSMDDIRLTDLNGLYVADAGEGGVTLLGPSLTNPTLVVVLHGAFTYDNDWISSGTMTGLAWSFESSSGPLSAVMIDGLSIPAAMIDQWLLSLDTQAALTFILAGNDQVTGFTQDDLLRGFGGADTISGRSGGDSLFGGSGDDVIYGGTSAVTTDDGSDFLRGEEGNDSIVGGVEFDDMHGNQGNDTLRGGAGGDWVVGGKDEDVLYGDGGSDVVLGNLGNDTLEGGSDLDVMRGGQANDIIRGDAGNDWLSGDRGDDTIAGGVGADTFHIFAQAGLDRVTDFNAAAGDRVNVLAGSQYSSRQEGADTIIEVTDGSGSTGQMVLVGVQLSSLPSGWIVVG